VRSLRTTLIVSSLLWTGGLLALMHVASLAVIHVIPSARGMRATGPVILGLALMVLGVVSLRRGLAPFRTLRERLMAVKVGDAKRVDGVYASEVQPLIDDLNGLLEDREKAVARAVATAGDLAHGLKTPLAVLAQEADRLGAAGNAELAETLVQQVERMSRQVNYHLARARAAASGAAGSAPYPVALCTDALVRTVSKLYAGRALRISSRIAPELCARVQREDLDEMLGNLLDNACQWANSRVILEASQTGHSIVVTVDDDGPGLVPAERTVVLERGVRLDEAAPGSGLGLAIVRDLSELYGGSVSLDDSPLGGLRARVSFPAY
jgi:signal transduction histidine kinase